MGPQVADRFMYQAFEEGLPSVLWVVQLDPRGATSIAHRCKQARPRAPSHPTARPGARVPAWGELGAGRLGRTGCDAPRDSDGPPDDAMAAPRSAPVTHPPVPSRLPPPPSPADAVAGSRLGGMGMAAGA